MSKSNKKTPKRKFSRFYFRKELVGGEEIISVVALATGDSVAAVPIRQDENEACQSARSLLEGFNALYDRGGRLIFPALSDAEQALVAHPAIGGDDAMIDVHAVLAERRQVAVIWSIDDVQQQRPGLTDEEAWAVLQECRRIHDCNYGFTWDLIDAVADRLLFDESRSEE